MGSLTGNGPDQIQQSVTMTDNLSTIVTPIASFWKGDEAKHKEKRFGLFHDHSSKAKRTKPIDWGPGGALGIGCGAGIGVAITGGAGIGATPWNALRLVLGVGAGCGVGLGYGFGQGIGVRWDRRPKRSSSSKRVVIEI